MRQLGFARGGLGGVETLGKEEPKDEGGEGVVKVKV